jgi:bifunctional DNase/RNase
MREMEIHSLRASLVNLTHVVILKEKQSERYLPIWIGPAEADAISIKLRNVDLVRPMTHDLLKNTINVVESLSGSVISRVVVNDLRSDTFYAQIVFEFSDGPPEITVDIGNNSLQYKDLEVGLNLRLYWQGKIISSTINRKWKENRRPFIEVKGTGGWVFELLLDELNKRWLLTRLKLDSRPSDAIALALRVEKPIFVEDSILDKAGILLDDESSALLSQSKPAEGNMPQQDRIDEQELKKLSAFYDFINTLDLDDFGKRKS